MRGRALKVIQPWITVARLLINLGAQVDTSNTKGWTPLDCAADVGALEVAKVLVSNDAPIEALDKSQTTPLHLACKRGHLEVVRYLVSEEKVFTSFRSTQGCL